MPEAANAEKDLPDLTLSFWEAATSTWVPESSLGRTACSIIWARFDKDFLSEKDRRQRYAKFVEDFTNGKQHLSGTCVNRAVYKRFSATVKFVDGNSDRACGPCVYSRRLCARLVDGGNGRLNLGFYPLPDLYRGEERMAEMDY